MRILIICTWFPPDTSIAAVRPYMFAKYLSRFGHDVTVLRSGLLNREPDDYYLHEERGFRVLSVYGTDSPAERYERGENAEVNVSEPGFARKIQKATEKRFPHLYKVLYRLWVSMAGLITVKDAASRFRAQKKAMNALDGQKFDVVFSTYSGLENVFAGRYAARRFQAKWIADFRDPIVQPYLSSHLWNLMAAPIQRWAIKQADLCTVAWQGMADLFQYPGVRTPTVVLHNGFDPSNVTPAPVVSTASCFTICYTGQIYPLQMETLRLLAEVIFSLSAEFGLERVKFCYAGPNGQILRQVFARAGSEGTLDDRGYVSRAEVQRIQEEADVFLVLSWKETASRGVLPGKFYEGIRAEKPILSLIAGNESGSELYALNEQYHYGYCCELAREGNPAEDLRLWLSGLCREKFAHGGRLPYAANPALAEAFRYDHLARKLETICQDLTAGRNPAADTPSDRDAETRREKA